MQPPPVAMAALKLRIQTLHKQLRQDRIIHALEAQRRSHLASEAEKARQEELARMNKGWCRHNANPHTPWPYRSKGLTKDEEGNIKVILVTEYRSGMERVNKMNAEAELAKARAKMIQAEQTDAYRKTQELINLAEELKVKIASETRLRTAKSSPEEDQNTTTIEGNSTDSDGNVNMGELWTATGPKNGRLVVSSP